MPRLSTIEFNLANHRNYSDEELEGRSGAAMPYRLFQLLGGAAAQVDLYQPYGDTWFMVRRKATLVTGSDDPAVLDAWVDNQYRMAMGLEPRRLPDSDMKTAPNSVLGAPAQLSLLGGSDA